MTLHETPEERAGPPLQQSADYTTSHLQCWAPTGVDHFCSTAHVRVEHLDQPFKWNHTVQVGAVKTSPLFHDPWHTLSLLLNAKDMMKPSILEADRLYPISVMQKKTNKCQTRKCW